MLLQGIGEVLCGLPGAGFDSSPSILVDSKPNGNTRATFGPRSDDEDDTEAGTLSTNFRTSPARGHLATTYDLMCNRIHTTRIFSGIGFRTWNPPAPKSRPYH
ncbi:hypothetical protein AVEN_12742-1 [Araneus ventricosus]|uniref:Uncharacterized protein n=1 Tax=Araneus ventricosus TaxID=182803 RepID=A0A4Y2ABN6_ARAVE|nr:hypothetical protein AVEN_12742-1 [Araneus ventricosus]